MLHVYAIIDDGCIRDVIPRGHEGDALAALAADGLAAVVSEAASASIEASVAHVWHHEKVLSSLMERHAVLPMRFGMVCTADDLSSLLSERCDALRAALQELRGKVEMAVRIHGPMAQTGNAQKPTADRPTASSGKAYLMALAALQRRTSARNEPGLRPIDDAKAYLDQLCLDTVWHGAEAPGEPLKASCLISHEEVEAFVGRLEKLEQPNLRVSCTGPWAPYSFVGRRAALGIEG